MSLGSRIKERREQLGLTRDELAEALGVGATAIGNYETSYSTPKIEVLYRIFDVLKCDANYLYQDEMSSERKDNSFNAREIEIIEKYRTLDEHGTEVVDTVLEAEYKRCSEREECLIPMPIEELRKLPLEQRLKLEPYIDGGILKVARKRKK